MAKKQNLDKLRQAFESSQSGSGGADGFKFWKPRDNGSYTIRFLPPFEEDGIFVKQTAQYKLGDKYIFAPYIEGKSDPIYDYYRALWKENTPQSIALARELKPRKQYLYNIVVREEKSVKPNNPTKVYIYMSGQKLYDKVMHYFWDEDYGDLTDIDEGYDFKIEKEDGSMGFPNYDNSKPRNKASALFEDKAMVDEVLGHLYNLDAEVTYNSPAELKEMLAEYLASRKETAKFLKDVDKAEKAEAAGITKAAAKAATESDEDDDDLDDFEKKLLAQIESD
jgi:hypothetical protein